MLSELSECYYRRVYFITGSYQNCQNIYFIIQSLLELSVIKELTLQKGCQNDQNIIIGKLLKLSECITRETRVYVITEKLSELSVLLQKDLFYYKKVVRIIRMLLQKGLGQVQIRLGQVHSITGRLLELSECYYRRVYFIIIEGLSQFLQIRNAALQEC